jgi:hypothetical protein
MPFGTNYNGIMLGGPSLGRSPSAQDDIFLRERMEQGMPSATGVPTFFTADLPSGVLFFSIAPESRPTKLVLVDTRFLNQHSNERGLDSIFGLVCHAPSCGDA